MNEFPMNFESSSHSQSGINTSWETIAFNRQIDCAVPKEFDGPGEGFSPEDLYSMALMNCFIGTFKVMAEKSKLEYDDIKAQANLRLNVGNSGKPWMDEMELKIILKNPDDQDRALRILDLVSKNSMIINSVKTKVKMSWEIVD
jgi:organic hydroperoxide reductase OsmC/OhrA